MKIEIQFDHIVAIKKRARKERRKGRPWGVFCSLERIVNEKIAKRRARDRA